MASYEADGIELFDARDESEGHDIIMDMPTHAEVERRYRILDQTQAKRVLDEAAAYAETEGWRVERSQTSPGTAYRGGKQLAPGDATLLVAIGAEDVLNDPDGPRVLRIKLEFGAVPFDDNTTTTPLP